SRSISTSSNKVLKPEYDPNAKWDACLDLSVRHFVYAFAACAFTGLLFFRSLATRWASVAFGAGIEQTDTLHAQMAALAADLQAAKLIQPHHGGGDQGSLLQRSMRLEVPKFNGTEPERFNLEGAAAEWFRWMSRNKLITSWEGFLESVRNRFGPCKYEDPQGSLSKLLQTGTVAQYQSEFEKLMNRVTDISENLLISFYISGLKPTLQRELLVAKPTSLGEAFSLARVIEARLEDQSPTSTSAKTHDIITVVQTNNPTPSQVSATSLNSGKPPLLHTPTESTTNTNTTPLAIKWISPEEHQEQDDNPSRELPADQAYYLEEKVNFEGEVNVTTEDKGGGRTKRVPVAPAWHKDFVMR
nr:hypothetical protein [Tanacetum cinerariifolium]